MVLDLISLNLYDGICGIALFMSALYYHTGDEDIRHDTLMVMAKFCRMLRDKQNPWPVQRMPLGLGGGVAGIIKSVVLIGGFLGESAFCDDIAIIIKGLQARQIQEDKHLDILGGCGGLLAVLADLYSEENLPKRAGYAEEAIIYRNDLKTRVLSLCIECGEHLLKNRVKAASGHLVWDTGLGTAPLTGMGHGAGGIANALFKLYRITGESRFYKTACEALDYEQSLFDPDMKNWPDLRHNPLKKGGKAFMAGWCSGAPGIGLARLGTWGINNSRSVRQDIEQALEFTLQYPADYSDHVCCGNGGRIDFLIEAAHRLNKPELLTEAGSRLGRMLQRKKKLGQFVLPGNDGGVLFDPSFFQGLAGIGYELLRFTDGKRIPGILT